MSRGGIPARSVTSVVRPEGATVTGPPERADRERA
jgi:hypothetical protein